MKNRVRELRSERGWSQTELGDRLGVSRQTVNAIENERYDPSLPLAFVIARVFERPIEALFFEATPSRFRIFLFSSRKGSTSRWSRRRGGR